MKMKNTLSLLACFLIGAVLLQYRVSKPDLLKGQELKVTQWDAFGYYMYLPAFCIYKDYKKLDWLAAIDKEYQVTGGDGWQAERLDNGNYVFKYLGGIAIMQAPFFFIGDFAARHTGYPADGFSRPYQYALSFGALLYCMLAILLLRRILLYYFSDRTVALCLLLITLATNFIQYAAVDNGLSHCYIFLLYTLVLYTTIKWHGQPRIVWALLTGYIIGLATMSRPTEAIMLFIPLLWGLNGKDEAKYKWSLVRANKSHVAWALLGGLLGILPQLIYWKLTTGSFLYDVGSKWEFLSPHFRVLFGWEKGWFIYTPVAVFFIAGMFLIRRYPFRRSVIWFCLLNIYIIIAWHDWRYGASYSTRALVQSYPVFALPFAALVERAQANKGRWLFYLLCLYLLLVNLFQVKQYGSTVLHYNDMNRKYYSRIYLNPSPSALDFSLLDAPDFLSGENGYAHELLLADSTPHAVVFKGGSQTRLLSIPLSLHSGDRWIRVDADVYAPGHLWASYLQGSLHDQRRQKQTKIRLFRPLAQDKKSNHYAFYMHVPRSLTPTELTLSLCSSNDFNGTVERIKILKLERATR